VSTALVPRAGLGDDVLAHLEAQIASAQRLLDAVLRQGQAIRARQVEEVLGRLTDIQAEMGRRTALEAHRAAILSAAGNALGIPPHTVTLEALSDLLQPAQAVAAAERSAQLRGLLAEITREHAINRALMRQELSFLDHLMRELGGEIDTGYAPRAGGAGRPAPRAPFRTLDLEA
jgi:flagellar FlgN protein